MRLGLLSLGWTRTRRPTCSRNATSWPRRPEITLGPDWLPYIIPINLPVLPWRIRVDVDWDGAAKLAMQP